MTGFPIRKADRPVFRIAVLAAFAAALLTSACHRNPRPRLVEWPFDPSYANLDRLLIDNATPDGVRYAEIAKDPSELKIVKLELAEVTREQFEGFSREAKLAFLINAHNIYAIDRIVRNWPVENIEDTEWFGSALEARDIRLAGHKWSLLDLRTKITGPDFKESRAIFMLNWGMRGCPPLSEIAPTPANIDALMERQTRQFIQNSEYNKFERHERRFVASELLEIYRPEIERDYTTLHLFVQRFSDPEMSKVLRAFPPRFAFAPFDTTLNDAVILPVLPPQPAAPAPAPAAAPAAN